MDVLAAEGRKRPQSGRYEEAETKVRRERDEKGMVGAGVLVEMNLMGCGGEGFEKGD